MNLRSVALVTVALVATGGGLAAHTATASAASTSGVSAGPLHWDPSNPATRNYYIPTISPGGSFSDQMRVQNPNDDSVDLYVNAVDGITAIPSGAVYANRTDPVRKAGAWVTPAVSQLTIAAHQEALVGFTVHVPAEAVPGDHLAGVAFENAHPTEGSGPISITSVLRTVVGVLVKVPGPAVFHVTLSHATIQPLSTAGYASVVITITNDGRLLGRPVLTLTLSGPNGYAKTMTHAFDTILPGDTIALPFPWHDTLGAGAYHITVVATAAEMAGSVTYSGPFTLGGALAGVPAQASPKPAPGAASTTVSVSPAGAALPVWVIALMIGAVLLLLGILGLVFALLRVTRRQRDLREASTTQPVSPTP